MIRLIPFALGVLSASPALAQEVIPCDWQASVQSLVEPWEDTSRVYANGNVRVAMLDTIEPAAAAFHLMILSPPHDDFGGRQCVTVGHSGGAGFAGMFFDDIASQYSPQTGLNVTVPVVIFLPDLSFANSGLLSVTINQSTGEVTASLALGEAE